MKLLYICNGCKSETLEDFDIKVCPNCGSDDIYLNAKYEKTEEIAKIDPDEELKRLNKLKLDKTEEINKLDNSKDILRDEFKKIEKEITEFKNKHFIVVGSYVRLTEDIVYKKGFKKITINKDIKGIVLKVSEDNIQFKEGKTSEIHTVNKDLIVKIEWEEYKEYIYYDAFIKAGRNYLEYREGDILLSDFSGRVWVCKKRKYNGELYTSESLTVDKDIGDYFGMFSPLVFVENRDIDNSNHN